MAMRSTDHSLPPSSTYKVAPPCECLFNGAAEHGPNLVVPYIADSRPRWFHESINGGRVQELSLGSFLVVEHIKGQLPNVASSISLDTFGCGFSGISVRKIRCFRQDGNDGTTGRNRKKS